MFEMILLAAATLAAPDPVVLPVGDTKAPAQLSELSTEGLDAQRLEREHSLNLPSLADPHETAAKKEHAAPDGGELKARSSAVGLQFARSMETYASGDRQIRIEVLRPDNDEHRPAILILHGASGMGDGTFYRGAAEIFAERGYITFIPHYLETSPAATKTASKADKAAAKKSKRAAKTDPKPNGSVRAGFPAQEKILRDALDFIAAHNYVDPSRVGVFGLSLGGFHALSLSSQDYRIGAVVDMSGALRGNNMPESNRIAPTLALHGAKDPIVPVARAKSLAQMLKSHGIPHELQIYPDQGHFFRGKAQLDALQRSVSFFNSYLSGPEASRATRFTDTAEPSPPHP